MSDEENMDSRGPLQVIDATGEVSPDLEDMTATLGAGEEQDGDAVVVSALGVRGSGKSTLLNALFGTHFEVGKAFSASKGTKGVWAETADTTSKPIVVMDVQGCDGRGSDMEKVNRLATFTLCFSDVIIFNVWCADVGRYEAAGYGLLRSMFHEYLKIFKEERRRTLILFVIRDHDDGSSLDSLKSIVMNDLQNIWEQVTKPSDCEGMDMSELLDFDFVSLPHMRHRKSEFEGGINNLRVRFSDESSPDYALKEEYSKAITAESFGMILGISWRDLDRDDSGEQPSRRDLVAAYRCDLAYHAQHGLALKQINRWVSEVDAGRLVSKFGQEAGKLINDRLKGYELATSMHANAPVRQRKENELKQFLKTNITEIFQKQILTLQTSTLQQFKDLLLKNVYNRERRNQAATSKVLDDFAAKGDDLVVQEYHLSFHGPRNVLRDVLNDYAQRFSDSPTMQLTAMQHYERRAQRPVRRQTDARISLNLTGAVRPRGYGNFQLATRYAEGPLAMNFSVCNDADAAEQEGHGQVPLFKFQPTINYDLDL
eukprot:Plantae.Rhodophyta-Purpureofilum_apyrenoidigerum.ctg17243.p1 GENE.Plantae.Rhodophyta-Purpureofilum_apyrenoidigerum.ctg17243~~Plantae.Rhodophyta-Purpureofilum_apyrenoidigerum.ctg17243.p1  ORF type:complete len:542 (-),score=113.61 Plantae.Rhodophyta-Purpureofilum_apyrenoidigerum.ctg17243:660-2285(-)